MKSDEIIYQEGLEILTEHLGLVDTERFIVMINSNKFDYTKWQENLFEGMTVEEISHAAAEFRRKIEQTQII